MGASPYSPSGAQVSVAALQQRIRGSPGAPLTGKSLFYQTNIIFVGLFKTILAALRACHAIMKVCYF
jgi:hypothetical protein